MNTTETETISEQDAYDRYDMMLDDMHDGVIVICGENFIPSRVMKKCDQVAYRTGFHNYIDSADFEVEGY